MEEESSTFKQLTIAAAVVIVTVLIAASMSGFSFASVFGGNSGSVKGIAAQNTAPTAAVQDGVQTAKLSISGFGYKLDKSLLVDVPARIEVDLKTVTGCATDIVIDAFGVRKRVSSGDNIIEFTPDKAGTFNIHCSMNMVRGSFVVVEADGSASDFVDAAAPAAGGSCGGSGGGCGCGGA